MSVDVMLRRLGPETVEADVIVRNDDDEGRNQQNAIWAARSALATMEGQRSSSIGIKTIRAIPGDRAFLVTMNACEPNTDDEEDDR